MKWLYHNRDPLYADYNYLIIYIVSRIFEESFVVCVYKKQKDCSEIL